MSEHKKWWYGFLCGAILPCIIGAATAWFSYKGTLIQERQLELQVNATITDTLEKVNQLTKESAARSDDKAFVALVLQLGNIMSSLAKEQKKVIVTGRAMEIHDLIGQVAEIQKQTAKLSDDNAAKAKQIARLEEKLKAGVTAVPPVPPLPPVAPTEWSRLEEAMKRYWKTYTPEAPPEKTLLEKAWEFIKNYPGVWVYAFILLIGGVGAGTTGKK